MQGTYSHQDNPPVKVIRLLVCLLVVLSLSIYAERLPIKTYTTADGLVRDTILRRPQVGSPSRRRPGEAELPPRA